MKLKQLSTRELVSLRLRIDGLLKERRLILESQLADFNRLSKKPGGRKSKNRQVSSKVKVAPKYQSKKNPDLKWTGRGRPPLWLVAEMKSTNKKREEFAVK